MDPTTNQSTPHNPEQKVSSTGRIFLPVLMLIVGFAVATGVFYAYPIREKIVEKPVVEKPSIPLPSDAVKLSACVPHMGEHWVRLSDIHRGPYYLVYEDRVLGLEYMFKETEIPNEIGAHMSMEQKQKFAKENKLTFSDAVKMAIPGHIDLPQGAAFKTWDIEWSAPHAGLVEPHFDTHFYLVDQSELETVCPDAQFGSELPPDLAEELTRLGVPLP